MSNGAPLPSSFDNNTDFYEENRFQKFTRLLRQEPLVPLGCILTCWALLGASRSIRRGDHATTNRMFRARIYAQGFTLVAICAGSFYWREDRDKRKELSGVLAEKKAQEKRDAWIRELEVRDAEDTIIEKEKQARFKRLREREQNLMEKERDLAQKTKQKVEEVLGFGSGSRDETNTSSDGGDVASCVMEASERRNLGILDAVRRLRW
ncbi:Respiratory supercomplex factor 1, mitochondrial [Agyrium rufum]|nr:Respiratory supercomplex factor 1, mitochondrial [Agyrium rufum]